jgi:hypothetical protein
MTKARQLIGAAAYDPATLKILGDAFDEAWESIAGNYNSPLAAEAARLKLANIVLSLAAEGERDWERLKDRAIRSMIVDEP